MATAISIPSIPLTPFADLEDEVFGCVVERGRVREVNNGIGAYEYWGQRCFDKRLEPEVVPDSATFCLDLDEVVEHLGPPLMWTSADFLDTREIWLGEGRQSAVATPRVERWSIEGGAVVVVVEWGE